MNHTAGRGVKGLSGLCPVPKLYAQRSRCRRACRKRFSAFSVIFPRKFRGHSALASCPCPCPVVTRGKGPKTSGFLGKFFSRLSAPVSVCPLPLSVVALVDFHPDPSAAAVVSWDSGAVAAPAVDHRPPPRTRCRRGARSGPPRLLPALPPQANHQSVVPPSPAAPLLPGFAGATGCRENQAFANEVQSLSKSERRTSKTRPAQR